MPLPYMPSGNDRPHGKAGCPPGGKPIVGADSISARFAAPRGCPGRCEHRPLQDRRVIFPVGRGPAVGRRGGIYPSRGRCGGGVRRDEGIPPYGRFIGSAYTGKAACFRRGICGRGMPLPYMPSGNDRPHGKAGCPPGGKPIVGADSISARGVCGAAGLPGTMRASSPTGVCYIAGFAVSRLAAGPPWVVGEGFIPPAGSRRRGDLREGHAPPLHAFRQRPATREGRMPARRKTHCRGGFYIRPGVFTARRGCPGRCEHRPLQGFVITRRFAVSRLAARPPWFVGEGFIPPAGVRGGAGFAGGACPSPTCLPAMTGHTGRPDARPAENPL